MPVLGANGEPDASATYDRAKSNLRDAIEYNDGVLAARDGTEEVLEQVFQDLVWVWERSLDYQLSMAGVRSSFMLGSFDKLCEVYAPARGYLEQQLELLEEKLERGELTRLQVFDLNALLRRAQDPTRMAAHMRRLLVLQPELADEVGHKLWSTWIDAEDWELFEMYPRDPEDEIEFVAMFKGRLARRRDDELDQFYAERIDASFRLIDERLDKAQRAYELSGLPRLGETFSRLRQERGL